MTIRDIARRCGVSVSTVSRVLNDHPDVSAANREKVLQVVRELHYVPNTSARDLVRPQSDGIGLVVRGVGNPFFTGVIRAIERAIEEAGYSMVLHQIRSGEDEVRSGAELARSRRLLGQGEILGVGIVRAEITGKKSRRQQKARQRRKKDQLFLSAVLYHPSSPPARILGSRKRQARSARRFTPT